MEFSVLGGEEGSSTTLDVLRESCADARAVAVGRPEDAKGDLLLLVHEVS